MHHYTRTLKTMAVALGMSFASQFAVAQDQIGSFTVFIGKPDLTNAKGATLTTPWRVLQRDRTNYHRFGVSQPGDQWDPYFGDSKSRKSIQALLASGNVEPKAASRLKNGGSVLVRVFGRAGKVTALRISIPN